MIDFRFHIDMLGQFSKYDTLGTDTQDTPYDYSSVMHYQQNSFTANGSATIVPLQANVKIGQRYYLSPVDIAAIRKFYTCSGVGTTLPTPTVTTSEYFLPTDSMFSTKLKWNDFLSFSHTCFEISWSQKTYIISCATVL